MNEAIAQVSPADASKVAARRWSEELRAGRAALRASFLERVDTGRLLRGHTRLVDRIVSSIWPSAATVAASSFLTPTSTC